MAIVLYEHFVHLMFISPFWSLAGLIPFASETDTLGEFLKKKHKYEQQLFAYNVCTL